MFLCRSYIASFSYIFPVHVLYHCQSGATVSVFSQILHFCRIVLPEINIDAANSNHKYRSQDVRVNDIVSTSPVPSSNSTTNSQSRFVLFFVNIPQNYCCFLSFQKTCRPVHQHKIVFFCNVYSCSVDIILSLNLVFHAFLSTHVVNSMHCVSVS